MSAAEVILLPTTSAELAPLVEAARQNMHDAQLRWGATGSAEDRLAFMATRDHHDELVARHMAAEKREEDTVAAAEAKATAAKRERLEELLAKNRAFDEKLAAMVEANAEHFRAAYLRFGELRNAIQEHWTEAQEARAIMRDLGGEELSVHSWSLASAVYKFQRKNFETMVAEGLDRGCAEAACGLVDMRVMP